MKFLSFNSKKDAQTHLRELLHSKPLGEKFKNNLLEDVVKLHPEADLKIGCGIDCFSATLHKEWNTKGFLIHRIDGSTTDFSYLVCLKPRSHKQNVLRGARTSTYPQIKKFRAESTCPITGEASHVDHIIFFQQLFEDWMQEENLTYADIPVNTTDDMSVHTLFTDKQQTDSWNEYHLLNAKLRLISASANLSRTV